jgi:hypothetical protein
MIEIWWFLLWFLLGLGIGLVVAIASFFVGKTEVNGELLKRILDLERRLAIAYRDRD